MTIESNNSPVFQAFLATLFTWFVTAVGSSMVFFFTGYKRSFLDASLGFAAGIMTAASFWSLLVPALEISTDNYGGNKKFSCIPVTIGFLFGALFVYLTDYFMPDNFVEQAVKNGEVNMQQKNGSNGDSYSRKSSLQSVEEQINMKQVRNRGATTNGNGSHVIDYVKPSVDVDDDDNKLTKMRNHNEKFRKILLLIIAVTVHNVPEGLAVGVGFGAIGKSGSATYESARNLAFGIGLQNFPEGLAVSLPLYASGFSYRKSFFYGQLSGMVEPIAGVIGALTVNIAQFCLPYALAFAAGAMIYVVFENLIPEAASNGNSKLSTWCCIIGFCVMMCLDVGFG